MSNLSTSLPLPLMLTKWASQLNPVLSNIMVQGKAVNGVILAANTPLVINTQLGRVQQGYIITDQNSAANVWRTQPYNDLTLTLEASANTTLNLWVF